MTQIFPIIPQCLTGMTSSTLSGALCCSMEHLKLMTSLSYFTGCCPKWVENSMKAKKRLRFALTQGHCLFF